MFRIFRVLPEEKQCLLLKRRVLTQTRLRKLTYVSRQEHTAVTSRKLTAQTEHSSPLMPDHHGPDPSTYHLCNLLYK